MADVDLWVLVDRARERVDDASDVDEVAERLVDLLVEEGPDRIRELDVDLRAEMARAYGWSLWGAAHILNGGSSDDGFDYFLGWLVGQGRAVFENALADPDSLAEVVRPEAEGTFQSEELLSAAWTAYERATGEDLPDGPFIARPGLGPGWDFDNPTEMRTRYPRLWAMFGWS